MREATKRAVMVGLLLIVAAVPAIAQDSTTEPKPAPPGTKYHFEAMTMLVSRARGATTTIADDVMTGYPFGVLVMRGRVMFDFELMPMVQQGAAAPRRHRRARYPDRYVPPHHARRPRRLRAEEYGDRRDAAVSLQLGH